MGDCACCNELITTKCFDSSHLKWKADFGTNTLCVGKLYDYVNNTVNSVIVGDGTYNSPAVASEYSVFSGTLQGNGTYAAVIPRLNNYKDWVTNYLVHSKDLSTLKADGLSVYAYADGGSGFTGYGAVQKAPVTLTNNFFFAGVSYLGNGQVNFSTSGQLVGSPDNIYSGVVDPHQSFPDGTPFKVGIVYGASPQSYYNNTNTASIFNRYATYNVDTKAVIDNPFDSGVVLPQFSAAKNTFAIRNASGLYCFVDTGFGILRLRNNIIEGYLPYNSVGRMSYIYNPNDRMLNILSSQYPIGYNIVSDSSGKPINYVGPQYNARQSGYVYNSVDYTKYFDGLTNLMNSVGTSTLEGANWSSGNSHDISSFRVSQRGWGLIPNPVWSGTTLLREYHTITSGNTGYDTTRLTNVNLPQYYDYNARGVAAGQQNVMYVIDPFTFVINKVVQLPSIDQSYAINNSPTHGILVTPVSIGFQKDPLDHTLSGYTAQLNKYVDPTYTYGDLNNSGIASVYYDANIKNIVDTLDGYWITVQSKIASYDSGVHGYGYPSNITYSYVQSGGYITFNNYNRGYDIDASGANKAIEADVDFKRKIEAISSVIDGIAIDNTNIFVTYTNQFDVVYRSNRFSSAIVLQSPNDVALAQSKGMWRGGKVPFTYDYKIDEEYVRNLDNKYIQQAYNAAGIPSGKMPLVASGYGAGIVGPYATPINDLSMTDVINFPYAVHNPVFNPVAVGDIGQLYFFNYGITVPGASVDSATDVNGITKYSNLQVYLWSAPQVISSYKMRVITQNDGQGNLTTVNGYADITCKLGPLQPDGISYAIGMADATFPGWSATQPMYVYGYPIFQQQPDGTYLMTNGPAGRLDLGTASAPYYQASQSTNGTDASGWTIIGNTVYQGPTWNPRVGDAPITVGCDQWKGVNLGGICNGIGYGPNGHAIHVPFIANGYWGGKRTMYGSPDENCQTSFLGQDFTAPTTIWGASTTLAYVDPNGIGTYYGGITNINTHPNGDRWTGGPYGTFGSVDAGSNIQPLPLFIYAISDKNGMHVGYNIRAGTPSLYAWGCPVPEIVPDTSFLYTDIGRYQYSSLDSAYVTYYDCEVSAAAYAPIYLSMKTIFYSLGTHPFVDDVPEMSGFAAMCPWYDVTKNYTRNITNPQDPFSDNITIANYSGVMTASRSNLTQPSVDTIICMVEQRVAKYDKNYNLVSDEAISSKYKVQYPTYQTPTVAGIFSSGNTTQYQAASGWVFNGNPNSWFATSTDIVTGGRGALFTSPHNTPPTDIPVVSGYGYDYQIYRKDGIAPPFYGYYPDSSQYTAIQWTYYGDGQYFGQGYSSTLAVNDKICYIDLSNIINPQPLMPTNGSQSIYAPLKVNNQYDFNSFLVTDTYDYNYPTDHLLSVDSGTVYLITKDLSKWIPQTYGTECYSVSGQNQLVYNTYTKGALLLPEETYSGVKKLDLLMNIQSYTFTSQMVSGFLGVGNSFGSTDAAYQVVSLDGGNTLMCYSGVIQYYPSTFSGVLFSYPSGKLDTTSVAYINMSGYYSPSGTQVLVRQYQPQIQNYFIRQDFNKVTSGTIESGITDFLMSKNFVTRDVIARLNKEFFGSVYVGIETDGADFLTVAGSRKIMYSTTAPTGYMYPNSVILSVEHFPTVGDSMFKKIPTVLQVNNTIISGRMDFGPVHYSDLNSDGIYNLDYNNGIQEMTYSEPLSIANVHGKTVVTGKLMVDRTISHDSLAAQDFALHHPFYEAFAPQKNNKAT
jgi:hypothetical protein